jgi:aminoglycoside phosphotransferase (APT) family kinase protein
LTKSGALIGSGRSADVYEYGPDRVQRRYREPRDTEREVAGMKVAREAGFPVAEAEALSDTEIVMTRLHGPTMLEALGQRPWQIARHAGLLASLHDRLHSIEAPDWLPAPLGEGRELIHLDLHPDNVILTDAGPSVIDWPNVARGPGIGDVAYSWIILATAATPRPNLRGRLLAGIGRRGFIELFLGHFDRAEVRRWLAPGAAARLEDRTLPPSERLKVEKLARP